MRLRAALAACVAIVGAIVLAAIEPRLHMTFPSLIDDWVGIRDAPEQLREVARLGSPEGSRYRPGFIMWNGLQWHTLDAPTGFFGPQLWGLARFAVLVVGVTLLTALLVPSRSGRLWNEPRRLLVVGVPVAAITAPSLAIDIARYGTQEPLLVGCMSLGAVLLVRSLDALLVARAVAPTTVFALAAGLVLWAFGVFQKETSVCVLLLAPFLLPTLRGQRPRWERLDGSRRLGVLAVAAGILLPFVPMLVRTVQLALADERIYQDAAAGRSLPARFWEQLERAGEVLHSHLPAVIVVAALVLVTHVAFRTGVDWLSVGFLVVGLAFVLFAAEAGVVASRYLLPTIFLAALALARSAVSLGSRAVCAVGVALVVWGSVQAADARGWVQWWVDGERDRETLVREAASRQAGGCRVDVTGLNVELVQALPVLVPLAEETPRDCVEGERFVVVIDPGGPGTESPPDDPVLAPCAPEPEPVWSSHIGKIVRCTA